MCLFTDNLNVYEWNSRFNYYKNYSMQGKHVTRSYKFTLKHDTEIYSFIGVDACLAPGPKRPFNFIGLVDDNEMDKIKRMKQESIDEKSNFTLWFGHYPTSSIAAPKFGLREIIKYSLFIMILHIIKLFFKLVVVLIFVDTCIQWRDS